MTETDYTIQKMRWQIHELRRLLAKFIAENELLKAENDRLFKKTIGDAEHIRELRKKG